MKSVFYLGIDVGTGSARAGLFTAVGDCVGMGASPIRMWKPEPDHVEQSSEDIWRACGRAVRSALKQAAVPAASVGGIGFDATCSLVVLDGQDKPVTVSRTGVDAQNVMVWMDHRAVAEADLINRTRHPVLKYVGGVISPEMETPKLLWLRRHLPGTWTRAARFFDLPDFLTYRATGDDTRSLCSTVCKWTYLGQNGAAGEGWDASYFKRIWLTDLVHEGFRRVGTRIRPMGEAVGSGLTSRAARELGLLPGIPVGVSIIDAHAGGLGMLGAGVAGHKVSWRNRLALIGGTSSCHMAVSDKPVFVPGVWGPYFSAMLPGLWLTEGGQSATGALIDHVIHTHPAAPRMEVEARRRGLTVYEVLNERLDDLARRERVTHPAQLTRDLHVQPDFHGNRSPRANPGLRGMISGLTLSATGDDLARLYLSAIQAVACGTHHILKTLNARGYAISTLFACGGGTKNPVFLREHADVTGCRIVLPREPEAVLLGSAVLGAVASGRHPSVLAAMAAMNHAGREVTPGPAIVQRYHSAKYQVFHAMHDNFVQCRKLMGIK